MRPYIWVVKRCSNCARRSGHCFALVRGLPLANTSGFGSPAGNTLEFCAAATEHANAAPNRMLQILLSLRIYFTVSPRMGSHPSVPARNRFGIHCAASAAVSWYEYGSRADGSAPGPVE